MKLVGYVGNEYGSQEDDFVQDKCEDDGRQEHDNGKYIDKRYKQSI